MTGDTVHPGRLYVQDAPAFLDSLDRLVRLAESREVRAVMGCHIEMSRTSGWDYPVGTTYQPDERPLQMSVDRLGAVRDVARLVGDSPGTTFSATSPSSMNPDEAAATRRTADMTAWLAGVRSALRPAAKWGKTASYPMR